MPVLEQNTSFLRNILLFSSLFFILTTIGHAKNLNFDVTGSVTTAYDDNITYVDKNRLEDFETNLETGFILMQQGEKHQINIKGDVTEQIFASHSNLDNTSEDLNLTLQEELTQHDRLALVDILTHSDSPLTFEDAFGRTTGRYSSLNNQNGISYTHDFTKRLSAEMHYGEATTDYSQKNLTNSSFQQVGGTINYTHDSADIFNATYDYIRRSFEHGFNATTNSIAGGIRRYLTRQFYTDLSAGWDIIYNSINGKENIEPHYKAAITDQVDENTNVSLNFEKSDTTNSYTQDLFNSWRTSLNLYRKFSLRLSGNANIFYGQGNYNNLNVSDQLVGMQSQLTYAINKKTNLQLGYQLTDSISNTSTNAFRKNYIYLSVTFLF